MDLDQEYLEYIGESSLALLAISAAYFFDPGKLITLGTLLLIPVLFGYTAYISRDGFKTASVLSSVSLIFIPLGALTGFIALSITLINVMISLFASGTGLKNYSGSTFLPMLFTGLIIGLLVFGASEVQPQIKHSFSDTVSTNLGETTADIVEETGLIDAQKDFAKQTVSTTSEASVILTGQYIQNNTDLDQEAEAEVLQALQGARNEVPLIMEDKVENRAENATEQLSISNRVKDTASMLIEANFSFIILVSFMFFYAVNPVVAILTAISAKVFEVLDSGE